MCSVDYCINFWTHIFLTRFFSPVWEQSGEDADRALYELEACIMMQPSNTQECYRSSITLYAIPDPIGTCSLSRTIYVLYRWNFAGQKNAIPRFLYLIIHWFCVRQSWTIEPEACHCSPPLNVRPWTQSSAISSVSMTVIFQEWNVSNSAWWYQYAISTVYFNFIHVSVLT